MEFDKPSTKHMFYGMIAAAVIGFALLMNWAIRKDMKSAQEYKTNKAACEKLKFGDELTATDGFFEGVKGTAVDIGRTTVRIQYYKGLLVSETYLHCSQVRKL